MPMLRYVRIRDQLYLVAQHVPLSVDMQHQEPQPLHHILLLDRSGSMTWTIHALIDHVTERILSFPPGDVVSVGWFSGEGEYRFVVKGFCIGAEHNPASMLTAVLNTLRSTLNTTCFSEILANSAVVLSDLLSLTPQVTLTLFTDGCPVVSNYQRELAQIRAACDVLSSSLTSALLVGYGGYYNKALMAEMAERLHGTLTYADTIPTFAVSLERFVETARTTAPRVTVTLPPLASLGDPFTLAGSQVMSHALDDAWGFRYAPQADVENYVYFLVNTIPAGATEDIFDPLATVQSQQSPLVAGMYGAACLLLQQGQSGTALDVLGVLGDVALIDAVTNAFTLPEIGAAEQRVQAAIGDTAHRFRKGRQLAYVPKADAFCVLDALDLLLADPDARFYPYHPEFTYSRIGRKSTVQGDYPAFVPDKQHGVPLHGLTWHQEFLNLSMRVKIPGTVTLPDDAELRGFQNPYPTHIWRNFALIKDGMLNTKHLPISCSYDTSIALRKHGAISTEDCEIFTVHLEHLPVMNRAMAQGHTSATALCKDVMDELRLMAVLKVLRAKHDEMIQAHEAAGMTDDEATYLEHAGIGKNGYGPPTTTEPATDFYLAKTFTIKAKGLSSLPSLAAVEKKRLTGKPYTPSEALVALALDWYGMRIGTNTAYTTDASRLAAIEDDIADQQRRLCVVRSRIQRAKFAVLMGRAWFEEFPTRADTVLMVDGVQYTFDVRDDIRVEV